MDEKVVTLRPELEEHIDDLLPKNIRKAIMTFQRLADKAKMPFILITDREDGTPMHWRSGATDNQWCIAVLESVKHETLENQAYANCYDEDDDEE